MRPHTKIATAKVINTIENDPPAIEMSAPNVIGATNPPSVPPVLTIPIDEPITFSGKILCGQEKIATKMVVSKNVRIYKQTMDGVNVSEKTIPTNNKDERIQQPSKSAFSLPAKYFVNNTPANNDASVPPTALNARMVPTVLIDKSNLVFRKEGSQDIFP